MKRKICFPTILACILATAAVGQNIPKWSYGVSASYGKDKYDRKIHTAEKIPGAIYNFKSDYSWGLGLWGTRSLSPLFSLISRLNFSTQNLPNQTLCNNCGSTSQWYQYERHYWGSGGLGIRGYLNGSAKMKLFAETGLSGDWFLGYTEAVNHKKDMYWDAQGYHQFTPSANLAVGFQFLRVGILAEYQSNIARTFHKDGNGKTGILESPKISLVRSGFSIKTTFQINRPYF